jgi:hypothetical protein
MIQFELTTMYAAALAKRASLRIEELTDECRSDQKEELQDIFCDLVDVVVALKQMLSWDADALNESVHEILAQHSLDEIRRIENYEKPRKNDSNIER